MIKCVTFILHVHKIDNVLMLAILEKVLWPIWWMPIHC